MRVGSFLKLVEIQTKIASMMPFMIGTAYAAYHFKKFNAVNFFIMLVSLLAFDMATTALNNYYDYKRAFKKYGFNYERHNAIIRDNLKEASVVAVIFSLIGIATVFGLLLVANTNFMVLAIGAASFSVGILYSFGPVPISRTPLGEIFSGFFMGFVIIFLSIYIHVFDSDIVSSAYSGGFLSVQVNIRELLNIFLLSIPAIVGIANIMLANNICDIDDDIENRRYTLPIYIGKVKALTLFKVLYYIAYLAVVALVVLKLASTLYLLLLLTFIIVNRNIKIFYEKQTKKDTFVVSVKNFILICGTQALLLILEAIGRFLCTLR